MKHQREQQSGSWSNSELARGAVLYLTAFGQIENGRSTPNPRGLRKLAGVLGHRADDSHVLLKANEEDTVPPKSVPREFQQSAIRPSQNSERK